jgi:hypothetical protein
MDGFEVNEVNSVEVVRVYSTGQALYGESKV